MKQPQKENLTIKDILEKLKASNLSNEIEKNNEKLKESYAKLNKIKANSLKEFVYANKNIPQSWKNKINYKDKVFEIFVKDQNFLYYVANSGSVSNKSKSKSKSYKKRPQTTKNKILFRNTNKSFSCISNTGNNINSKRSSRLASSKYYSSCKNIHRHKDKSLEEQEINRFFDDLGKEYPIKKKLFGMFPERLINNMNNIISSNVKQKNKFKVRFKHENIDRINEFKNNIYLHLIPSQQRDKLDIMKKDNKIFDNSFIKKQFENKNNNIMKQLESINYYGPYYSYCPPCYNRNVDYYNNLDDNKLIQIIQQIKKRREESILNLSEKSKKMTKNNSFYY